jgi:hypothetical protein
MSTDLLVWLLLAVTTLHSCVWQAISTNNRAVAALLREHRAKIRVSQSLSVFAQVLVLASMGLWTAYAVHVEDWRFAAIAWVPYVFGVIGRIAARGKAVQP